MGLVFGVDLDLPFGVVLGAVRLVIVAVRDVAMIWCCCGLRGRWLVSLFDGQDLTGCRGRRPFFCLVVGCECDTPLLYSKCRTWVVSVRTEVRSFGW